MELTDFLTKIQYEVTQVQLRLRTEICITISNNRAIEIIKEYTNHKGIVKVSSFQLFGFNTYPSEFISDNDFVVGYKTINNEK